MTNILGVVYEHKTMPGTIHVLSTLNSHQETHVISLQ